MRYIKRICSACRVVKPRCRVPYFDQKTKKTRAHYFDKSGKLWNGGDCPECRMRKQRLRKHKPKPKKDMDLISSQSHARGRQAEYLVAGWLMGLGKRSVKINDSMSGPDVTYEENGKTITVEVKRAVKYPRRGHDYWLAEKVRENRKADDFLIFVGPNNEVCMSAMADHLKKCRKDGRRNYKSFKVKHLTNGK